MSAILMGWATVLILDGPGLGPSPGLMYMGIRGFIWDILS